MITRNGNKGFFVAHYDWIALAVGVVALGVGIFFYISALGEDPDEAAKEAVARIDRMKPKESGVKPLDMTGLKAVSAAVSKPTLLTEVGGKDGKDESFLASERRVLCVKCGKAISGNVKALPACPYCGEKQQEEKKVVLDKNENGIPDEWETRMGLTKNFGADEDPDGDGFTNLEEYKADTDPTKATSHPDHLDFLKVVLPLKETYMPFALRKAYKVPAGWRCEFIDPSRKDDNGRKGKILTAIVGGEIEDKDVDAKKSGFVLKSYTAKSEKRAIPGSDLQKAVDVSEAVVERKRDGKVIRLVIQEGKQVKLMPIDVQATLRYEHGEEKTFEVVPGAEIVLGKTKTKYRISGIKAAGKGAKVMVEDVSSRKTRTLEALEP